MSVHSAPIDAAAASVPKFRVNARSFSLTYPMCPIALDTAYSLLFDKHHPVYLLVATEKHESGDQHIHAHMRFSSKKDVRRPDYFDVLSEGIKYHPNVQRTKKEEFWNSYCKKEGCFKESSEVIAYNPALYDLGSKRKKYEDWIWEKQFLEDRNRIMPSFPIVANFITDGNEDSYTLQQPRADDKRRHWWIQSNPDAGKTYWLQRTFANQRVFSVCSNKYPLEGYEGEPIIVFDDKYVDFRMCASIANVYTIKTHVYGETRYRQTFYPLNSVRTIIVLDNRTIERVFAKHDNFIAPMLARFKTIYNVDKFC